MHYLSTLSLLAFSILSLAWEPPGYGGYSLRWVDTFDGASGVAPDGGNWNIITGNLGVNNELQTYTSSSRNLQRSGGATLQLVPWRDGSVGGGWTSGRVESKYTFTPAAGVVTRIESLIRFGTNSPGNKQGLWPAFWMLGNAIRNGVPWPQCGELDIMETVNGILTGHGTIHCNTYPGGVCNEPTGIGGTIGIPNQDWHTWRIEIDRRSNNWQTETLQWSMDGIVFHSVSGSRIGNEGVWNSLARSPLFVILNMAVGGDWPGYPNSATLDGYGSMMEVAYVAHYSTATLRTQKYQNETMANATFSNATFASPQLARKLCV